jgi:hypothetical protein
MMKNKTKDELIDDYKDVLTKIVLKETLIRRLEEEIVELKVQKVLLEGEIGDEGGKCDENS